MNDVPPAAGPVGLVVNTRSRSGQTAYAEALRALAELGIEPRRTYRLGEGYGLDDVLPPLREECGLIILGGGDGTISAAVDYLADRPIVLGVLPLGTANDFAKTLEIPTDLSGACTTIAEGKVVDVDLGLAGKNYYVNVASVGLAVEVTHALTPRLKKVTGGLAYPLATLKAVATHRPFVARITFPDGDHQPLELQRTLQIGIGNGRFYGGGSVVAPGAGIDDNTLDVYTIEMGRRRELLKVGYHFKSGAFVHTEAARHYETTRVHVETEPELAVNLDGELEQHTPQPFTVARNALHVVVPRESAAARAG